MEQPTGDRPLEPASDQETPVSWRLPAAAIEPLLDRLRSSLGDDAAGQLQDLETLVDALRARQAEMEARNRELREAQTQLQLHRDLLAELYDEAPVGYVTLNASGQILQANRTLCTMLHMGSAALVGLHFSSLVLPEYRSTYYHHQQQLLLSDPERPLQPLDLRLLLGGARDQPIPVVLHCTRSSDQGGRSVLMRIAVIDNSEAEHAESALRRQRDYADRLLDTAHVMVVVLDAEGRIEHMNRYSERLTASSLNEVKGCKWVDLFVPPADTEAARRGFSPHQQNTHGWSMTLGLHTREGARYAIEWRNTRMYDAQHRLTGGVLCVGIDVTELRRLRQREHDQLTNLAHQGRLSLIEQVTTQIAHELNQPLAAIANYCHVMDRRLSTADADRTELSEIVAKIAGQARRSGQTIRHLRRFASRRAPEQSPVDLNEVARNALALLEHELARVIDQPQIAISPTPTMVCGDSLLLEQVAVNLLHNSLDALRTVPVPERQLRLVTRQRGRQVELRVDDSGPGLSEVELQRVFQGFYTTKPEGLGLGLVMCHRIIEMHEGQLSGYRCDWPDGHRGMRFSMTLPTRDELAESCEEV